MRHSCTQHFCYDNSSHSKWCYPHLCWNLLGPYFSLHVSIASDKQITCSLNLGFDGSLRLKVTEGEEGESIGF